jgi:transporter family protein
MSSIVLLVAITFLYAGYNFFVKVAGGHVPAVNTSTVLATISLQLAALFASSSFLVFLSLRGGHTLSLSPRVYMWSIIAGLCIGAAEILYFYLFRDMGGKEAMSANVAIPTIVTGTIIITMIASYTVLRESLTLTQTVGIAVVIIGILLTFFGKS